MTENGTGDTAVTDADTGGGADTGARRTERGTDTGSPARSAAGCLLTGIGAVTAPLVWAPGAAPRVEGGFEGQARDLSVLYLDLPLVVLGGAVVPLVAWTVTARWTRRPWAAALAAVGALALGLWGLTAW